MDTNLSWKLEGITPIEKDNKNIKEADYLFRYNFRIESLYYFLWEKIWYEVSDKNMGIAFKFADLTYDMSLEDKKNNKHNQGNLEYLEYVLDKSKLWYELVFSFDVDDFLEKNDDNILKQIISWELVLCYLDDFKTIVLLKKLPIQEQVEETVKRVISTISISRNYYIDESKKYQKYYNDYLKQLDSFIWISSYIISEKYPYLNINKILLQKMFYDLSAIWYSYENYLDFDEFVELNNLDVYYRFELSDLFESEKLIYLLKVLLEWKLPFLILNDSLLVLNKMPINLFDDIMSFKKESKEIIYS